MAQPLLLNQELIAAGEPGVLIGRYPGDSYAGGNPWSLLTAVTGEVFYKAGEATLNQIKERKGIGISEDLLSIDRQRHKCTIHQRSFVG